MRSLNLTSLFILSCLLIAAALVAQPLAASAPPQLQLSPPANPVSPNSSVPVAIEITDAAAVAAFEFVLTYDPQQISIASLTLSEALGATSGCDPDVERCAAGLALRPAPAVVGMAAVHIGGYSYGATGGASGALTLGSLAIEVLDEDGQSSAPLLLSAPLIVADDGSTVAATTSDAELVFAVPTLINLHTAEASDQATKARRGLPLPLLALSVLLLAVLLRRRSLLPIALVLLYAALTATQDASAAAVRDANGAANGMNPDVNGDLVTNVHDLGLTAAAFGLSNGDAGYSSALDLNLDATIDAADLTLIANRWQLPLTTVAASSPSAGAGGVALTRETIVRFSRPLDPVSVADPILSAAHFGVPLGGRQQLGQGASKLTLFYDSDLPPASRIRVQLAGDGLVDSEGYAVDVDGDGLPGGVLQFDFDSVSIVPVPGTSVCGTVLASETDGGGSDIPLHNVTISVDGAAATLFAVSDSSGDFCLDPAPAGRFFIHVDGGTALNSVPEGAYYPSVGKAWQAVAGLQNDVGVIYLPLVAPDTLQTVSAVSDTTIHFPQSVLDDHPEFADVQITVPAGSLYADDGSSGGMVGIAPVDPLRLPGTLPAFLNFPVVITVQTDGATNFDTPAPVCFPNLDNLPAASKSALHSFDHDSGQWSVVGSMTVSADGLLVCTDDGVGVLAPGWHGTQPGVAGGGGPIGPPPAPCDPPPPEPPTLAPNGCGPSGADFLIADSGAFFDFIDPCIKHDICYDTCGHSKSFCDGEFLDDMIDHCRDRWNPETQPVEWEICVANAEKYYRGVRIWPFDGWAWDSGQEFGRCNCSRSTSAAQIAMSDHYFMILDVLNETVIHRGKSSGPIAVPDSLIFAPNTLYRLWVLQDETQLNGFNDFITPDSGATIELPEVTVGRTKAWDIDNDGLHDVAELIIGTDHFSKDSDGDGINDGPEFNSGSDPLDGILAVTGIVGSVDTPGTAYDICTIDKTVVIADGAAGVAIFDASENSTPVQVGQVDTTGSARGVACAIGRVAVADRQGDLAVVDISDPPAAFVSRQVALHGYANAVAVAGDIAYAGTSTGRVVAVDMLSGTVLQTLVLPKSVQDLRVKGDYLYALVAGTLYTLDLTTLQQIDSDVATGAIGAGGKRLRLFAGENLLYTVYTSGYNTFDTSDPADPLLIAHGATAQDGWKQIVDNGSGTGVATVGLNSTNTGEHNLSLYNVSDPAQTDQFITEYSTPGIAYSVRLYNGLAYVADGDAGMQIVNYLSPDTLAISPTITLTTNASGGQLEGGQRVRLSATVTDDVQVSSVAFLLNDELLVTDASYPFEQFFNAPAATAISLTVQARAVDTGGNFVWSDVQTYTLVADLTPPTVVSVTPQNGTRAFQPIAQVSAIAAFLSEPLDAATVTGSALALFEVGADLTGGTADDVALPGGVLSYRSDTQAVFLTFADRLTAGAYYAELADSVADGGGNTLAAPHSWTFTLDGGVYGEWQVEEVHEVSGPMAAHFNPIDDLIYYVRRVSGDDGLWRIEADGSHTKLAGADRPAAVVADPVDGDLFVSEDYGGRIFRTEFGGSGRATWVSGLHGGDDDPVGMVVVPATYTGSVAAPGDVIVVDRGNGGADEIWRFAADTAEGETVIHSDNGTLIDAVDVTIAAEKVYVIDRAGANDGRLYEVGAGGVLTQVVLSQPLADPVGLATDPLTGDLLVIERTTASLATIDPQSGAVAIIFSDPQLSSSGYLWAGIDISADGQRLLLTSFGDDRITILTRLSP